ncbi:uncharacterized protein B0H18DRAFT_1122862 [Fomitopsis serialis]|uniref:uncharacterized protein n=1 Tax=Fomitopsis serialis TaxID=139415 RepID=UPI002007E124|nr:uncharacterized protein B0H18DRAFT_1122862 [Neoantrodia serialis]KAH9918789.1 hypothetical protein B0H18DRAFT_1122862 [Neoantrodia serialis]
MRRTEGITLLRLILRTPTSTLEALEALTLRLTTLPVIMEARVMAAVRHLVVPRVTAGAVVAVMAVVEVVPGTILTLEARLLDHPITAEVLPVEVPQTVDPLLTEAVPTGVRLDQKISRDSIPEWDGKLPTILVYLHKMNNLAFKNEYVARDLGVAAPDRFTGRAESWWQMLGLQHQRLYSSSWWALYQGIKIQFFTHKFLMALRTHYDGQHFRQEGHEKESPLSFID